MQNCGRVTENGVHGPHGQSVTKAVVAGKKEDIDSVINLSLCMEELTALEIGFRRRVVTHGNAQVSERFIPRNSSCSIDQCVY